MKKQCVLIPVEFMTLVWTEIALKMYSRGMLGNVSDYHADSNPNTRPTLYATNESSKRENVCEGLCVDQFVRMPDVATIAGVPSVKGLGLREAIVALEREGYNVEFEGDGYVVSQTPQAGCMADKGSSVKLTLKHI